MAKKVCIIGGNASYIRMFKDAGFEIAGAGVLDADLICFTGGEDVSPELYGDKAHPLTGNNPYRDEAEKAVYDQCRTLGIPMVGICRGGQFLNVMNGGRMYQHVLRHTQDHVLIDSRTGETIWVTSTHHQMIMPTEAGIIIATANQQGVREWFEGEVFKRDISDQDIEVVWYDATKTLCFQPHPEFSSEEGTRHRAYFFELISELLEVTP